MKDVEIRDIFPKANKPLAAVSVYRNGRWSFATLKTPTRILETQQFFKINFPFGLHKKGSQNAAIYAVKGNPGDYVSVDRLGTFALVTADDYLRKFPTPQQIPPTPNSSEKLRDPNFLTKTQLESVDKDSDKVLIGNKEFSLPSTTKQTIAIIETPTGQAQAYYDTSAGAMVYDYDLSAMVEVPVPDKPY